MRIVICGAGAIGRQVLQDLAGAGGHELVVVECDEGVADNVASRFDALVVHGDATDPDILEKAQIRHADALVALTGSDAINTVIAMLAHRFGLGRIIVRVFSNALRGALEEIGVSDIVAPTMAAAARVEAALHGAARTPLHEIIQGRLQIGELTVGPRDGKTLGDLGIPDTALAVAVVHGSDALLARPDDQVEEGDVVVIVAETEKALEASRKAVEGK